MSRRAARRARRVAVGDTRHVGLWLFPLFLLTAALAATLSGGLVVLYYAQQVADLRAETADARARLDEAVTDVDDAVDAATTAIDEQVARVLAELAQGLPVDSPNGAGVFAISAAHDDDEVRVGSAFTVFSDDEESFLVTTYELVRTAGGGAVESVQLFLPGQTVRGQVNGFDRGLDLATVVLSGGRLPVTEWRPADLALDLGDPLYLVGVAGPQAPSVVEGRLAAVSTDAVVGSLPVSSFTAGGPLLDIEGRVVAIAAPGFSPFGPATGGLGYHVPIRALCRSLLRCTSADVGAPGLGESGSLTPSRGSTAPGANATAPQPRPSPPPQPSPSQQPLASPSPDPTPSPTQPPPALPSAPDDSEGNDE